MVGVTVRLGVEVCGRDAVAVGVAVGGGVAVTVGVGIPPIGVDVTVGVGGLSPTHVPSRHRSAAVHTLKSSHAAPFGTLTQRPVAGSQVFGSWHRPHGMGTPSHRPLSGLQTATWHRSPSTGGQVTGSPEQNPNWQRSFFVHGLPSSHEPGRSEAVHSPPLHAYVAQTVDAAHDVPSGAGSAPTQVPAWHA